MVHRQTLETKVRKILETDEQSRNDDIRLTQVYWYTYHKNLLQVIDNTYMVSLHDLHELPTQDAISRVRRVIQNDKHEFIPTKQAVAIKRGMAEIEWRKYLGYTTEHTL